MRGGGDVRSMEREYFKNLNFRDGREGEPSVLGRGRGSR